LVNKIYDFLKNNLFIIIFLSCICIVIFSFAIIYKSQIVISPYQSNDIITKTYLTTNEKYDIEIYYPSTKYKTVNKEIITLINPYIEKLKVDTKYFVPVNINDKFKLKINYELRRVNKNIVSIVLKSNYSYGNSLNSIEITSVTYNLNTEKKLLLNDFFDERFAYIKFLCDESKSALLNNKTISEKTLKFFLDDISNSYQNSFDSYAFSDTHVCIYYNANKLSSKYNDIYEIKIPWENVKHLLKENIIFK
jgi:hypothetical protein